MQAEEAEDLFEEPIASSTLRIVEELVDERAVVEEISVQEESAETEALSDDEPLASTEGNTRPQATSGWAEVLFGSKDEEEEKN